MAKVKDIKIDKTSFNHAHYQGWTEAAFIKDQIASVPDSYGNEEAKKEFLKAAFAKINPSAEVNEKPKGK